MWSGTVQQRSRGDVALRLSCLTVIGVALGLAFCIVSAARTLPPYAAEAATPAGAAPTVTAQPVIPPVDPPDEIVETIETVGTIETTPPPFTGWSDPTLVGQPFGTAIEGLLTFRGNPTRTYYGEGPVPTTEPAIAWTYPDRAMCSASDDGHGVRTWCGTGWTGQPSVFERDGRTWLVVGTYDRHVHFLDADTGTAILPPFPTGDIIKGSVSVDPDGYPLVYTGSRDNSYRILSIEGDQATELWSLSAHAVSPTMWNNDWDGSGLVIHDHLLIGGENSQLHIVKLNRSRDADGRVTVDPQMVFNTPGWDPELLAALGDSNVSIEGSVTVVGDTVYFANSGGLVQGWDLSGLRAGVAPTRTFRYWNGDDTDATVVADEQGMLYVASEWERHSARAREVGQIVKLDPGQPADPLVWAVHDDHAEVAGVWATPAIHKDLLIVPTNGGAILGLDRATGAERWRKTLPGPTWSSPVVVDDTWIQGDCNGVLHAYDVVDTATEPEELWALPIGSCIESTPAVWRGGIYVGTRAGLIVGVRAQRP